MNFNNTQNFDEELNNYRSFKEHNIIEHNNETINPLYYIIDVFTKYKITLLNEETQEQEIVHYTLEQERDIDSKKYKIIQKTKLINDKERNIIFAPAHLFTETDGVGSHKEVTSYFNDKNYCVLVMNGKFKGFIYPDKTQVELIQFNTENNIDGELRESLVKWNELNPTTNLAITGYSVIERGITFNTIGFNFTHMILSSYHISSIGKASQIAGRGSGGKDYVEPMIVICPKNVKEKIISFNNEIEKICSLNPKYFNKTDFVNTNKTIPVKMRIDDNNLLKKIIDIRDKSKRGYKQQLHNILKQGIDENKITIFDRNNIRKFDIHSRELNQVRMYKHGDKIDVRRFKNFNDAYENYKNVSQSGDENQYNIDLAKDEYKQGAFINEINILWITFKY